MKWLKKQFARLILWAFQKNSEIAEPPAIVIRIPREDMYEVFDREHLNRKEIDDATKEKSPVIGG